jgi:hypothetical protein
MFRNHRIQRRWAATLLLLWLFGLASGVVNACLIDTADVTPRSIARQAAAAHHGNEAASAAESLVGHAAAAAHASAAADDSASYANCEDFCDKAEVSIAPLKSTLDDGQARALAPPATAALWPGAAYVPVRPQVLHRTPSAGPAIPIAFLRLAL